MVARIATSEEEDTRYEQLNRVKGRQTGGRARAEKLTAEERKEIAQKGVKARIDSSIPNTWTVPAGRSR